MNDIRKKVEAILFVYTKGLSEEKILEILKKKFKVKIRKEELERIIKEINEDFYNIGSAIRIKKIGEKYYLTIEEDLQKFFVKEMLPELPSSLLKVLAIVYKKQPIKQSKIAEIIGNRAYEYLKELEKLGFIRRFKIGKYYYVKLTEKFYKYFEVSKQ